ncbi:MAG: class I SAM-dependent methyltransferase [Flavobacterium sp.]
MSKKSDISLITVGDFNDVYHKLRQNGLQYLYSMLNFGASSRVASKWDHYKSASDFWLIPALQEEWNRKATGNKDKVYEDYVCEKYLKGKENLKILSVGCGNGIHERPFAGYNASFKITGVDLAAQQIKQAQAAANELKLNIDYLAGDFTRMDFEPEGFDLVLFHASLHHFNNISDFLKNRVKPLLKNGGLLVVFEYAGPNRLQFRQSQLKAANALLKQLPAKYRVMYDGKTIKKNVYRPGLLRMLLVDPSEAPDSDNLVQGIHNNFSVLEEVKLGWNITQILLKGIAHNFINDGAETQSLITAIIKEEDEFVMQTGENDAVFGIYQK